MSRAWIIFVVTAANFLLSQFYRAANAMISPQLLHDLAVDTKGLGLIAAAFFYAFALTQLPVGLLLDRVGAGRIMAALAMVGALGAVVFSTSQSLTGAVLGRVLLGVGMASCLMGSLKLFTVWFEPQRFAMLSGCIFAIGTVGNMAATTPMALLMEHMTWRHAFQLIAGVNVLLGVLLYLVVRDAPSPSGRVLTAACAPGRRLGSVDSLIMLAKRKEYWIISLCGLASYGIFAAIQTLWAGPYLMEVRGLSPVHAGNVILAMNAGLIVGAPTWGALSDRVFRTRKWLICVGLGAGAALMASLTFDFAASCASVMVIFFCLGLFRGSGLMMYTHIKELMPVEMAGTAMTSVNFFGMLGPAVFLQGLGGMMQWLYPHASRGAGAFSVVFWVCGACLGVAAVLYALTRDAFGDFRRQAAR